MKEYRVRRIGGRVVCDVVVNGGQPTPLEHKEFHSPDGFECGYGGSGPSDLARSIAFNATGRFEGYQQLKRDHIEQMPAEGGVISLADVFTSIEKAAAL